MRTSDHIRRRNLIAAGSIGVCVIALVGGDVLGISGDRGGSRGGSQTGGGQQQIPTTLADFFQPGTQPDPDGTTILPIQTSTNCQFCHGQYLFDEEIRSYAEPWDGWINSMKGQSARDPVWHAAVAVANQDAAGSGEFCIRCHVPRGWIAGRSSTGEIDALDPMDLDGVNCHMCHRMVSPVLSDDSPPQDAAILAMLDYPPTGHQGNARYVLDPVDVRRGPYDDQPWNPHGQTEIVFSPFHLESAMCGTCHDVSNPVFERQKDGSYAIATLGQPHPTQNTHDMMPEQRTYSEWLHSDFAKGGVQFNDGRFGGNHETGIMQSCQDCHMPKHFTGACAYWDLDLGFGPRNLKTHQFIGANTWVLGAIFEQHGDAFGLTAESVADAQDRVADMLRAAADMDLQVVDDELRVRIINWSGHKLPTGYPEGRRMWVNVQFLDSNEQLIEERGAYNYDTATLSTEDTKVYEVQLGMDEAVANAANLPAGKSFHLVLNNVILKDNRIPPVGFTNAAFEDVRAQPVNYVYADGQHWDDTFFDVPKGAASAVATLYYQTTSREYIEFLRDTNVTNFDGIIAYDLWVSQGKSAPLDMTSVQISLDPQPSNPADLNDDGVVDVSDLLMLLADWGICPGGETCEADFNSDGTVDVTDLLFLLANWG